MMNLDTVIMKVFIFLFILLACLLQLEPAQAYNVPDKYASGVVVAAPSHLPPMSFLGLNGQPKGVHVDFWRQWSDETGVPVRFKVGNWEEMLLCVSEGECNIHSGLYITDGRKKFLDYGESLYRTSISLFVRKDSWIERLDQLGGIRVAVLEKGVSQDSLRSSSSGAVLVSYPTARQAVAGLSKGETEAIVCDTPTVFYILGELGKLRDFKSVDVIQSQYYHAAVKKGDRELLEVVNWGMQCIDEETRERILNVWYVPDATISKSLKVGLIVCVAVLIGGLSLVFFGGRKKLS